MKTPRMIIAAAVLALAAATAHSADQAEKKPDKNEARLTKMLEGRTAGEPVSCIPMIRANQLEVIDGVALVFDMGDILYVSRPVDPEMLDRDDVMVIDRHTSQLCNTDVVHTVDRNNGYMTGVVFLNKFVPYKKQ